jgi:hypothetical protein
VGLFDHSKDSQGGSTPRGQDQDMCPGQRRPCTLGDVEVILSSGPPTPTGPQRQRSQSGGERSDVLGKIVQNLQLASGKDSSSSQPRDNLALLQQGEVLEQEIYNDLDTVLLIHQWPHTPAQKPTPNKAKRNSSIFFRFFHFFSLFFAFFRFLTLFFAFFRLLFISLQFFRLIFA